MTGFALLHHLNNKRLGERQRERDQNSTRLDCRLDTAHHCTVTIEWVGRSAWLKSILTWVLLEV
jgi:hypothetical protein